MSPSALAVPAGPEPDGGARGRAAREVVEAAAAAGLMLATAESLTAGAVVAALVDVPGASRCVAGGAACYTYAAKTAVLGVDADLLAREGAVNAATAFAMARGALAAYDADLAVSTTGVAGPGPDERGVPAGTVHLAVAASPRALMRLHGRGAAGGAAETAVGNAADRVVADRADQSASDGTDRAVGNAADRSVGDGGGILAVRELRLPGDRPAVRAASVDAALDLLGTAIAQVTGS